VAGGGGCGALSAGTNATVWTVVGWSGNCCCGGGGGVCTGNTDACKACIGDGAGRCSSGTIMAMMDGGGGVGEREVDGDGDRLS